MGKVADCCQQITIYFMISASFSTELQCTCNYKSDICLGTNSYQPPPPTVKPPACVSKLCDNAERLLQLKHCCVLHIPAKPKQLATVLHTYPHVAMCLNKSET